MIRMLFSLCLLLAPLTALSQAQATADNYAAWRDRVVQVQVIDRMSGQKAGTGSGFFAGRPGWVISNYHVVSELVSQPGRYQARFIGEAQREGELQLVAVDAVHDLALLRSDDYRPEPLPLATVEPPKGSRLWSMGFPFDIGLTIVEGTYNGLLERSLYEKLHFTGSINPGMSGGAAFNARGEVVGVNVSTAGNQVSFLVPVRFVDDLIRGADQAGDDGDELTRQVAGQLGRNQSRISGELLSQAIPVTSLDDFEVPAALAPYLNCWGNSTEEDDDELAAVYYRCETQDDIYLSASLYTGIIQFQHDLVSTESLGAWRFYQQLENRGYYPLLRLEGEENATSNYRCHVDFVDQQGLTLKVTFCARRYLRFEGLYDGYLEATSMAAPNKALQSSLLLAGFDWKNLTALSSRFISAIRLRKNDHD
jgi:hypothetical protein